MDMRSGQPGIDLCGDWQFAFCEGTPPGTIRSSVDVARYRLQTYPARVPGNLELDLLANGLIDEPFRGMNIVALRRFENAHAWYWRAVPPELPPSGEPRLTFEGLDCFATVYVDGIRHARTSNMLVPQHVDLPATAEPREVLVHLAPAIQAPAEGQFPALVKAMDANYESLYVRKAPHMYGWDIMPRAVSMGIWRPVTLRYLPRERLNHAYVETLRVADDGSRAEAVLHFAAATDSAASGGYSVRAEGACGDSRFVLERTLTFGAGSIRFAVERPRLWLPRGRGEQPLYQVRVRLLKGGEEIDHLALRWGIRTVDLLRTDTTDGEGSGEFCFRVNGEKLFVKGTNWVPLDAYHSRDLERVGPVLDMVEDVGCNMVRCWGGNVYESDRFYDLCDEKGILVWQDFAMACAVYPQDPQFQDVIRREARAVVQRLRQHACLALWAGDNECDYAYGWTGRQLDPNTNVLTRQVLPEVVREEDPGRPYLPSSPYISPEAFRTGKPTSVEHLWGTRQYYKGAEYRDSVCHFASEIGYHGCPDPESIRQFISPGKVWPYQDNGEWLLHSTSPVPELRMFDYRVELMASQVRLLFGEVPDSLEAFALASQASQAEAKKFFIELFRAAKWRRTGVIWWNIADGWPQFSDAVVDYYGRRKMAYDFIKRAQEPVTVIVREPSGDQQEVVVSNDTRDVARLECTIHDVDSGAEVLRAAVEAAPDAVTSAGRIGWDGAARRFYRIEWRTAAGTSGRSHYLAGQPPFNLAWYVSCVRRTYET